ncbi:MAG TPA: SUMF1/EgtB/PvdO family nonheme iron enzyme [Polyangiaceae bacterium]
MTSRALAFAGAAFSLLACRAEHDESVPARASASNSGAASIAPPAQLPEPRQGMAWIPRGPLVAGSAEDSLPRLADQEMPGEQLILNGFYIDVFPYPDEDGAIPISNVSQSAAQGLCLERGKRLCSELEWERACKGPDNHRYEYGDNYHADRCGMGASPQMRPVGLRVGCRSDFGTRDMHGGAFEWTSSAWGRGTTSDLVSVRGGNSVDGEVTGRCANAVARAPGLAAGSVGFRCCAGPENDAKVVLNVKRAAPLDLREHMDHDLLSQILSALSDEAKRDLGAHGDRAPDRQWLWHPIGNEELYVTRICSGLGHSPACGVAIDRVVLGKVTELVWASSRHWLPSVEVDRDPRDLWMIGGDATGTYQRLIQYRWGSVEVGSEEHRARQAAPKKKSK